MSQPIIEVKNLSKVFNKGRRNEVAALKQISFQVQRNSAVLLRGPSGSGKTTLLTILGALSKPSSGDMICLDQNISHWQETFLTGFRRKHIGIIFQNFNLIKRLTVFQNIAAVLIPLKLSSSEIREKVQRVTDLVQISHRLDFKASTLSGGEQQRVAIARAIIREPEILIADEPTAHLDSKLSTGILDIFSKLKKQGNTIIIATHDPVLNDHPLIDDVFCVKDGLLESAHVC